MKKKKKRGKWFRRNTKSGGVGRGGGALKPEHETQSGDARSGFVSRFNIIIVTYFAQSWLTCWPVRIVRKGCRDANAAALGWALPQSPEGRLKGMVRGMGGFSEKWFAFRLNCWSVVMSSLCLITLPSIRCHVFDFAEFLKLEKWWTSTPWEHWIFFEYFDLFLFVLLNYRCSL